MTRAIAAMLLLCGPISAGERPLAEGDKRYTPTRLEWLMYEMNSTMRVEMTEENGYSVDFGYLPSKNTVLIVVRYLPNVNREIMNISIEGARGLISILSSNQGWSSWLRIKEDIQPAKVKGAK